MPQPDNTSVPVPPAPPTANPDFLYPWDQSIEHNRHNVRAMCDIAGLPTAKTIRMERPDGTVLLVAPKDIIAACVKVESNFQNHALVVWPGRFKIGDPITNHNVDKHTGEITSTDFGMFQINSFYHIGPHLDFPSSDYVMSNPHVCCQFMIDKYKAGQISQWSSYKSKDFFEVLGTV